MVFLSRLSSWNNSWRACATTSMDTSTHISNPCYRGTSSACYLVSTIKSNCEPYFLERSHTVRQLFQTIARSLISPAVSALRRAVLEVKQSWSFIVWVTKNLLSRAPPCFGRHVKPVPDAFAVVSTRTRFSWWTIALSLFV
jgi:hypothetical protein